MKLRLIILLLLSLTLIELPEWAFAQTATSSESASQSPHRPPGFFDYALGRINPGDRNYGAEIKELRRLAVTLTLENIYFWFTALSLFLLVGVMAMHLLHLRADDKKEFLAASLITELWNGRVSDRIEIDRRTEQYNLLVAQKNAALEVSLNKDQEASEAEESADSRTHKKIERLVGAARSGSRAQTAAKGSVAEVPLGVPAATDLAQQNMLLERRIEAMRNTEQNLRERLNQSTSQLEDERKRNKALKGA